MSATKKFGKFILITLCITTVLFIYKSGFDEEGDCELANLKMMRNLLNITTKEKFCNSTAITNLAGAEVQNALDFLANQSEAILNGTVGSYLGLGEDPASVVN